MGGLFDSTSRTRTNQRTTESATSTPINPDWVTNSLQDYTGRINQFAQTDPYSYVAGPSNLQNQAFTGAGNLGGWQAGLGQARSMAETAGNAPANLAGPASTYTAQNPGNPLLARGAQLGEAQGYSATQLGGPALSGGVNLGSARGYNAAQVGAAERAEAERYQAAQVQGVQLGSAQLGNLSQAQAATLADPRMAARTQLGEAAQSTAGVTADHMGRYRNPYEQQVVNTTLAGMDENAGRVRAQQAAAAARNGAFGGSRYAIESAETEAGLDRNRAATEANLRSQGFLTAAGLGAQDADRQTSVGMQNAAARNQFGLAQGQMDQNRELFNTSSSNQADLSRAGFQQQANLFNTGEANNMSQFNTGQANNFALTQGQMNLQNNQFNTGQDNQARAQNAQLGTQASLFNAGEQNQNNRLDAGSTNQARQFRAGAQNQFALSQGQMNLQNNQFNAGARNTFALDQASRNDAASQFGANADNQFALTQGQMSQQNSQFNANERNAFVQDYMRRLDTAGQFNAGETNRMSMFDAGQQDNQLNRQLTSAGMMGDMTNAMANNQRADLGLTADLGAQQFAIEQARLNAPLTHLQAQGQMLGSVPYGLFSGSQVNSTGTMNGTNIQTDRPSLFNQMLAVGSVAFSDRSVKGDIKRIGAHRGLGIYNYRYLWDEPGKIRTGVMADEVEDVAPEALGPIINGFRTVDYSKLGLAHLVEA